MAVATGWSQFAVAIELADYRRVDANRGGLPIPRAASAQARRHGRPAGQPWWRRETKDTAHQQKYIENQPLAPAVYEVVAI